MRISSKPSHSGLAEGQAIDQNMPFAVLDPFARVITDIKTGIRARLDRLDGDDSVLFCRKSCGGDAH
jgi:hypothetical protein